MLEPIWNPEERHKNYPLLIEKNGFRIVLLNYTYGTNGLKTDAPNVVNYINREQIKKIFLMHAENFLMLL